MNYLINNLVLKARYLLNIFTLPLYLGNKFWCPLCNYHFRKMKDYKGKYLIKGTLIDHFTTNSICPVCSSRMRYRFTFITAKEIIKKFNPGSRLLHIGPEYYMYKSLINLKPRFEYIACDIKIIKNIPSVQEDIRQMTFENNFFDLIILNHVLEEIKEDEKAIEEIHRVMKKGAKAIVTVPIYGEKTYEEDGENLSTRNARLYGLPTQTRLYGMDIITKFEKKNFSVQLLSVFDCNYEIFDRTQRTPHTESDKYIFLLTKN